MSFTYCKLCGHKNLYAVNVPKFCGGCGEPLNGAPATRKEKATLPSSGRKKRTRPTREASDSSEEGTDIYEVPQIEKLQYEISDLDSHARVMKIEDVIPQIEEGPSDQKKKRKPRSSRKRKRK